MKILTKKWVEKHEQVKLVYRLKQFDTQSANYEEIKNKSVNDFLANLKKDEDLAKICLKTNIAEKLYTAKLEKDRKAILSLPKKIYSKIKNVELLFLGYVNSEDKKLLTSYANETLKTIEAKAKEANKLTEIAEDYLPEEFILDEVIGELVYEEYSRGNDYFINICDKVICIKDYEIIERENYKINKWQENNPLTLWTTLVAGELHYISNNCFELHLLLLNGDKYANESYWYFTLKGTDVKFV